MNIKTFLQKHERWIPFFLALLFIALTASGLATMQNPDELLHRVVNALEGKWKFDESNFDYPSLPKYAMYGVGKITYALGFADNFHSIARSLSVLLGAGVVFLTYKITRELKGGIFASSLAALFLISNHTLAINARFAHNDLYLTFFLMLTVCFLVNYQKSSQRGWLYAAFFGVGLAASSKYNGGIFLLVPLLIFFFSKGEELFREKLRTIETLFIGAVLTFLGFVLGTPKALLWMVFYFKRLLPKLSYFSDYGEITGIPIGLFGQWAVLKDLLGRGVYTLFLLAFFYFLLKTVYEFFSFRYANLPKMEWSIQKSKETKNIIAMLLLAVFVFDLPIMASHNYQARFFIPLLPFLSILAALFVEDLQILIKRTKLKKYQMLLPVILGAILFFSFLSVISIRLLLQNDPRIEASEFIATLPKGTKLEYTMYPPDIPQKHFSAEYSYPIFFIKVAGQEVPEVAKGKAYSQYNEGEAGLIKRKIDYLVIDSFTYARCENEAIYQTNPLECDFFESLLAGESAYHLIGDFSYSLPPFLPQISIAFVNPEIQVFQRSE